MEYEARTTRIMVGRNGTRKSGTSLSWCIKCFERKLWMLNSHKVIFGGVADERHMVLLHWVGLYTHTLHGCTISLMGTHICMGPSNTSYVGHAQYRYYNYTNPCFCNHGFQELPHNRTLYYCNNSINLQHNLQLGSLREWHGDMELWQICILTIICMISPLYVLVSADAVHIMSI